MVKSDIEEIQASTITGQEVEIQAQVTVKRTKIIHGEEIPVISLVILKKAAQDVILAVRLAAGTSL